MSRSSGRDLHLQLLLSRFEFRITHHTQVGYPGSQHSGNATIWAPDFAAFSTKQHVLSTVASKLNHSGRPCTAAALTNSLSSRKEVAMIKDQEQIR